MVSSRCGLLLLMASLCAAGDAPVPVAAPPITVVAPTATSELCDLTLADGPRLIAHWNASLYAKVWNDPALATMRTQFDASCAEVTPVLGFDPRLLVPAMSTLHVAVYGLKLDHLDHPLVQGMAWASFGDFSPKVMHLIATHATPTTVKGADEALAIDADTHGNRITIARFGAEVVAALNLDPKPQPLAVATAADLRLHADVKSLISIVTSSVPADTAAIIRSSVAGNANIGNDYTYEATIVPEGMLERFTQFPAQVATAVLDRSVLNALPANTMIELAMAADGKQLWKTSHDSWMQQYAMTLSKQQNTKVSPQDAEDQLNKMLASTNVPITLQEAVEALTGTMVLAIGQGIPFPTVTLAMPRSKAMDAVVDYGLKLINVEAPAEGASAMLPIPSVPVSVNLIRDAKHWVVSSDPTITATWTTGAAGGWSDAPAGKLALAKAPENSMFLGSSDTPAVLHVISGYLGMYMGAMHGSSAQQTQMLLQALSKLSALASTGYLYMSPLSNPSRSVCESRGIVGFIGIPVVAGLLAGKREMSAADGAGSEAATQTRLRAIALAENAFKSGTFIDQDGNGTGEYGLLSELGGVRPLASAKPANLLPKDLAAGVVEGWRFAVYLPDEKGGALDEADDKTVVRAKAPKAAALQEKHWVAYAWPDVGNESKHMFAILPDGLLRVAPFDDDAPEWSDIFGGGTWDTKPAWQEFHH